MPKEISEKTLKYYWAFGPDAFYEKDLEKLTAFANSIQILNFKLRHNEQFQYEFVQLRKIEPLPRDPDSESIGSNFEGFAVESDAPASPDKKKEKDADGKAESDGDDSAKEEKERAEKQYYDDTINNEEVERDQALFNELVTICGKIKEYFVPMGRCAREGVPKLFGNL